MEKICSSIMNPFGYVKLHGFQGSPLCDFKEWGDSTKKTLISQQELVIEY